MVKPWRQAFGIALLLVTMSGLAAAEPLSKAEFDAVVAEAVQVYQQDRHFSSFKRPIREWRTLDRDKLSRLLQMPEFAALDNVPKEPLIDQAGAWDLMPFDSPAAALALWEKWFPEDVRKAVKPGSRDVPRPHAFYADYRWAPQASANVALMRCYPNPAWYVRHDEPMLWALEHRTGWEQPNAFDFGQCVLQQGDEGAPAWRDGKETLRGKASAAILEQMFSRYLLVNRCKGEGPNRCLPMLHALRSLNPKHESLVPILKAIEPDFALGENIVIPEAIRGRQEPGAMSLPLTDAQRDLAHGVARQVMRKVFFLTAKIPVLLDRPQEWPGGEIERTVRQVVDLTLMLELTHRLSEGRNLLELGDQFFADPWRALAPDGVMPAAVEDVLRKLGREQGAITGCRLAQAGTEKIPAAFWVAYTEEKFAQGQPSCDALTNYTDAAKRYGEAVAKKDAKPLVPFASLKHFIDGGGAAQKELVNLLAANCPPIVEAGQADPWRVCSLAAKARAEEDAKRKAQEPAPPPPPPPACADSLPARVAKTLGYLSRPEHEACKPMPNAADRSIVALSYLAQGLGDSDTASAGDGSYDVDVLVVDSDTERVQSRLLLEKLYESDAVRFDGMQIDTARYRLSPEMRAFGLRAEHSISSHAVAYSTGALSLFIEQGSSLRRVLADLVVYKNSGELSDHCEGTHTEVTRTVAMAPTRSHGFADILVTTATTDSESRQAGDDCEDIAKSPVVTQTLLRFDGKTYPVPDELR